MNSERNDPPTGSRPAGTPLEPVGPTGSAASTAKPADAAAKPSAASAAGAGPAAKPDEKPAAKTAARPAAASTPASASPRRGMGVAGVAMVALVVSIVVAGVLIATAPRWTKLVPGMAAPAAPAPAPAQPDPRIAELATRIEQLASRPSGDAGASQTLSSQIAALREELTRLAGAQKNASETLARLEATPPAAAAVDLAPLRERLDRLQQELQDAVPTLDRTRGLRGEMDALIAELGKVGERNAAIDGRLAEIEKAAAAQRDMDRRAVEAAKAAAIVALGARLRQEVAQGQDTAAALAALRPLAAGDEELTAAVAALPQGAAPATLEQLRQRFPAVAREIVTADAGDQAGTWWEKAWARVQNLVSVRRTGPGIEGEDAEARVAQAEAALKAGRLDQAVAALKPLGGQAAKEAAPWLADAEKLMAAQAAADRIVARGAALLARDPGPQPATR